MTELLRPWKLASLAAGTAILVAGAGYAPDWDVPVSLLMAACAYLTAPWALRVWLERRWAELPLALFAAWFTVDGVYTAYWSLVDPAALVMRPANFGASLALYGMCAVIWLHRGPLFRRAS